MIKNTFPITRKLILQTFPPFQNLFCTLCKQSQMSGKMLSLRQVFPSLNITSIYWTIPQRSISKKNAVLRKMGLPEQPKRPLNGFLNYCKSLRPQITAQNPDMSPQDVLKTLSKKWQKEPEHEKQKYAKEYEAKLKAYKSDIEKYNKALTSEVKEEMRELVAEEEVRKCQQTLLKKLKEQEKELKKPKRPVSAFFSYLVRAEAIGKGTESVKQASEMWKELPKSEKDKYNAEFLKEMKKYKEDLLKWEEEMLQQGNIDFVKLKTIKEKLRSNA